MTKFVTKYSWQPLAIDEIDLKNGISASTVDVDMSEFRCHLLCIAFIWGSSYLMNLVALLKKHDAQQSGHKN